jgi:hypothetical protein
VAAGSTDHLTCHRETDTDDIRATATRGCLIGGRARRHDGPRGDGRER